MTITQKITFFVSCLPMFLLGCWFTAQAQSPTSQPTLPGSPTSNGEVDPVTLENPLRVNSLEELLVAILNIFMVLMIPIVVFFIIWAGFKYVTAQGNPGQIEEATTTFTYAVIGGVLILAAVAIAEIIRNTVDSFAA